MNSGCRRSATRSQLAWRSWDDDEFVVYHSGSGDTHLLNRVGAEALRALEREALTSEQLSERVAQALDCRADEDFQRHIMNLLAEFDDVGLIERIS